METRAMDRTAKVSANEGATTYADLDFFGQIPPNFLDTFAEAVKLASGSAKTKLEGLLQEFEAVGAKEPVKDKPLVKATMLEMQPAAEDSMLYIYRITSDVEVEGMEPITAKLWLGKDGNAWRVSKFVQEE